MVQGREQGRRCYALVKALMAQPTHSAGTIEQRLVDALTAVLHPDKEWSSRGRKDFGICVEHIAQKNGGLRIR